MPDEIETLLEELRSRGYRITMQRRLVIEMLSASTESHHSCEAVTEALAAQGARIDHATVYRVLQWLKDVGLIAQTDLGEGRDVYSWLGGERHHHLICLNCGRVISVDDSLFDSLRRILLKDYGFQARIEHFAIFGLCQDCAEKTASGE